MSTPMYDPNQMTQIAAFFTGLKDLIDTLEPGFEPTADNPLYVFGLEIVIRHRDDYTVGRFAMDDFLYFEQTGEDYVSATKAAVDSALAAHTRQEDTAAGAR